MQIRIAKCGHEYSVPDGLSGRRRNFCEACGGKPYVRPSAVSCRGCGATIQVGVYRGGIPKYCSPACYPSSWKHGTGKKPGFCLGCAEPLDRTGKKYCSKRCGEVVRGTRLPEPLPARECALRECTMVFTPKRTIQRCCSERHGKMLWNRESRADGRQKPEPWSDRRRDNYHRRKALKRGASTGEPVRKEVIARRDRWRCQLCGERVSKRLAWPHPRSASLDHIVPLTKDGAHEPANVQLAHLECNTRKHNRGGGEQLALIG